MQERKVDPALWRLSVQQGWPQRLDLSAEAACDSLLMVFGDSTHKEI